MRVPHTNAAPMPAGGKAMRLETITQEFKPQLLHGWLVSCLLHGLVLVSLLPLFRHSVMTLPKETFHWEVALVQSTPSAHESGQTVDVPEPAMAKQPDRIPTASHTNRTIRHTTPSTQPIPSLARKSEAPVTPLSTPGSPSLVTSSSETVSTAIPNELPPPLIQTTEPPRQQTETPVSSTTPAPSPRPAEPSPGS